MCVAVKKRPHKKERLGVATSKYSRKVRPIQHICKSITNYFSTTSYGEVIKKRGREGEGREEGDIYRYSVGFFDVEDKVLYEGHFVQSEDDLESSGCHLCQDEEVEGDGIDLEVTPCKITNHS